MYVCPYVHSVCVSRWPQRPAEGVGFLAAGVTNSCGKSNLSVGSRLPSSGRALHHRALSLAPKCFSHHQHHYSRFWLLTTLLQGPDVVVGANLPSPHERDSSGRLSQCLKSQSGGEVDRQTHILSDPHFSLIHLSP